MRKHLLRYPPRAWVVMLGILMFGYGGVACGEAGTETESSPLADPWMRVSGIDCGSVRRTHCPWLTSYLGLYFPTEVRPSDLRYYEQKLLTTGVFTSVRASLMASSADPDQGIIKFDLDEKWTTIPVIRGAYGGGTPLRVLGIYDTHSFGRLWTLGAETRKYGNAPTGYVLWATAPRWGTGKHVISAEYWREPRVRTIYDSKFNELGHIHSDDRMVRLLFMHPIVRGPLRANDDRIWQLGWDLRARFEQAANFTRSPSEPLAELPANIWLNDKETTELNLQPRLVYDDTNVDNLTFEGIRFVAQGGPLWTENSTKHRFDMELFYYKKIPDRFNLALHSFVGGATSPTLQNQYFLGGFDSIRGIPDGAIYGVRAAYANVELRYFTPAYRYAWFQFLAFTDVGAASDAWKTLPDATKMTAGVGVRIAIPQVYRLIFRLDYAWSLDDPAVHGLTAGLNQFFDPYRPL